MIGRATIAVTIGAIVIVLLASLALCSRAEAQARCAPWQTWLDGLESQYGEKPAFNADTNNGVVTVTVNPDTGTWTMLLQPNSDIACMIGAGRDWRAVPVEPEVEPFAVPQIWRLPGVRREYQHPAFFGPLPSY